MKKLIELIPSDVPYEVIGDSSKVVNGFSQDSRSVSKHNIFVARKGASSDGHDYIEQVLDAGIEVILCEIFPKKLRDDCCYIQCNQLHVFLSKMLNLFYEFPSQRICLVGITGTNGKTSVASLLYQLFYSFGYKVGLISTIVNKIHDIEFAATHTTPELVSLYQLIDRMIQSGCSYIFMEVSSHAIDQGRIEGLNYKIGVFTNLTHDHLDYHKTMLNYINAKKKFFDQLSKEAIAIVNIDDKNGEVMLQNTKAKRRSYSLKQPADFRTKLLDLGFEGMHLKFRNKEWHSQLLGEFNAYNLTAVLAVALELGMNETEVLEALSKVKPIDGRFDWFYSEKSKKFGVIDYAHTPDALEKILKNLKQLRKPSQKIICVMGCGGNRDQEKRPKMGRIGCEYSDHLIITSDNPRDENPEVIIQQIENGIADEDKSNYLSIVDRYQAIKTACMISNVGDIILIAGKGHETYQEIQGVKTPFNDKLILKEML